MKAGFEFLSIEFATDEHQRILSRHTDGPRTLQLPVEHHVYAVKDVATVLALERQDTFHAEDIFATALQQVRQPIIDLLRIEHTRITDADRRNLAVMMMRSKGPLCRSTYAVDTQVEFRRRMLAEHGIGTRSRNLDIKVTALMTDVDPVETLPRRERRPAVHGQRIFGERPYCRLDGRGQTFGARRRRRNKHQAESALMRVSVVIIMVVMMVVIMSVLMRVSMIMVVRAVGPVLVMLVMRMRIAAAAQRETAGRQLVHARPLEWILGLEEGRVDCERTLQIEGADVQNSIDRYIGITRAEYAGRAVDGAHPSFDALEFGLANEIGFIEQDHVGKRHLLAGFIHLFEMFLDVSRIDYGDDRIEQKLLLEVIVKEKRLRHGAGVGHAGSLHDDVIELVAALEQLPEDAQQVTAYGAADATVVGFEDFFFGTDHELMIDTHLAELVLDHGDALAVVLGEDAIEQRGLSRPQESRQYGDGDPIRGSHRGRMITYRMAKAGHHHVGHDHSACIEEAVHNAAEVCARRGLNLTPIRRRVLEIVWRAHDPIGAYDILGELSKERDKAAPPTVYRALEFLMDAGLVHRIDSLNAFIGCYEPARTHVAQFLVCRKCHRVAEIDDPAINRLLAEKSLAVGFRIEPTSLEIKGLCGDCEAAAV